METNKNIASVICAYKELSGKSNSECARALELSCSAFKDYAAGRGNPSIATLEHLSLKLGIDLSYLICGCFSADQTVVMKKLLDVTGILIKLPPENREIFAEELIRLVKLTCGDAIYEH